MIGGTVCTDRHNCLCTSRVSDDHLEGNLRRSSVTVIGLGVCWPAGADDAEVLIGVSDCEAANGIVLYLFGFHDDALMGKVFGDLGIP